MGTREVQPGINHIGQLLSERWFFEQGLGEAVAGALTTARGPRTVRHSTDAAAARVGPYSAFASELAAAVLAHVNDRVVAGGVTPVESGRRPPWRRAQPDPLRSHRLSRMPGMGTQEARI